MVILDRLYLSLISKDTRVEEINVCLKQGLETKLKIPVFQSETFENIGTETRIGTDKCW